MNIYLNCSLPHELNKCHICKMSTAIIPVTNVYSSLQENQVNSEHTVGLTPQNQINTVGMAVETCYHGLVSTSFTPSLTSPLIIPSLPTIFLTSTLTFFLFSIYTKLISTSGTYCSLGLELSSVHSFAGSLLKSPLLREVFHDYST